MLHVTWRCTWLAHAHAHTHTRAKIHTERTSGLSKFGIDCLGTHLHTLASVPAGQHSVGHLAAVVLLPPPERRGSEKLL